MTPDTNHVTTTERAPRAAGIGRRIGTLQKMHEIDVQRAGRTDRGTRIFAPLNPPLDLGLHIETIGFSGQPQLGFRRVHLDDANWDMEVAAVADEPERAAMLFRDEARGAVLALNASISAFTVTDKGVEAWVLELDDDVIVRAEERMKRVVETIDLARDDLPPAAVLAQHVRAVAPLAKEHDLEIANTPFSLNGTVRSARVNFQSERRSTNRFDFRLHVTHVEGPIGAPMLVRRESLVDRVRKLMGFEDLQTNDPAFDPVFLVQGQEPARLLAGLDADARGLLLDLARRFDHVVIDADGLLARGDGDKVPHGELVSLVEAGTTVVERIARASAAETRGPYR